MCHAVPTRWVHAYYPNGSARIREMERVPNYAGLFLDLPSQGSVFGVTGTWENGKSAHATHQSTAYAAQAAWDECLKSQNHPGLCSLELHYTGILLPVGSLALFQAPASKERSFSHLNLEYFIHEPPTFLK